MPAPLKIRPLRQDVFELHLVLTKEQGEALKNAARLNNTSLNDLVETAILLFTERDNEGLRWFRVAMAKETYELALELCDGNADLIEERLDQLIHEMLERESGQEGRDR